MFSDSLNHEFSIIVKHSLEKGNFSFNIKRLLPIGGGVV